METNQLNDMQCSDRNLVNSSLFDDVKTNS